MKKFFIVTILLLWTCCVFAQVDFRKGHIVTHDSDTLSGLLDYREASRRYRVCTFKPSAEGQPKAFGPGDIQGYGFIQSGFFVSEMIEVEGNGVQPVFLEVLVEGRISLFRYENDFFVSKDGSVLHKLVHTKHVTTRDGGRVMVDVKQYIGLLKVLMLDRPDMETAIQRVTLSERKLTELVGIYNGLHDAPVIVYKSRLPYVHATVGIAAGVSVSTMQIAIDDTENAHLEAPFEAAQSPAIGLSVDVSSPRINQRVSFRAGVLYQQPTFYSYKTVPGPYFIDRHYVTIAMPNLQLPIGLKYNFPERRYTPYVNAGALLHYRIGGESEWVKEREMDNVIETYPAEAANLRRNQLGLWGGIGIRRPLSSSLNVFLECRYSKIFSGSTSTVSVPNVGPSMSSLQLFLGIRTR